MKDGNIKNVGMAAAILSFGILLSRFLGYAREALIAYQHGAGEATDAYNAAFLLPDLMNYFLAGGTLSITFIPLLAAARAGGDESKGHRLFSMIATTMGLLLIVAVVLGEIFTKTFVSWLFPGFDDAQIAMTAEMTRIVLPGQLFHYIGGLFLATLMTHGKFLPSALSPMIYNASIIVCGAVFGPTFGIKAFSYGALLGAFLGPVLMAGIAARHHIRYKPVIALRDPDFVKYILLTLPLMLGVSLTTVDEWVGRIIGSTMDTGTISWLNYARRLMLVPIAVVGQAAGQDALPYLSKLWVEGKIEELASVLIKTLGNVIMLSLILTAFMVVLAEPSVAFVYERGAFDAEDTAVTAFLLQIFSLGIVAWTVQSVAVRAFYARQNTLKPMLITTCVTVLTLPVYFLLAQRFGASGLAASTGIGMSAQALSVMLFYRKENPHFSLSALALFFVKGVVLATIAAVVTFLAYRFLPWSFLSLHRTAESFLQISIAGSIGLVATALALKKVAPDLYDIFGRRLRRRKRHQTGRE